MPDLSSFRWPSLALVMALAACGGSARFPSLAQRPAEREFAQATPAAPPPEAPGTPDPAIVRQAKNLRDDATRAHAAFARRVEDADRLSRAAHGSQVGSEAWAAATTALGALDSARNASALALANLDSLKVSTAVAAAAGNDAAGKATYAVVTDADAAAAAMLADEDAHIAAVHKAIPN